MAIPGPNERDQREDDLEVARSLARRYGMVLVAKDRIATLCSESRYSEFELLRVGELADFEHHIAKRGATMVAHELLGGECFAVKKSTDKDSSIVSYRMELTVIRPREPSDD